MRLNFRVSLAGVKPLSVMPHVSLSKEHMEARVTRACRNEEATYLNFDFCRQLTDGVLALSEDRDHCVLLSPDGVIPKYNLIPDLRVSGVQIVKFYATLRFSVNGDARMAPLRLRDVNYRPNFK